MSLKSTSFPKELKQIERNLRHGFVDKKTAEDNNAKINASQNITCTFLLFKAIEFV